MTRRTGVLTFVIVVAGCDRAEATAEQPRADASPPAKAKAKGKAEAAEAPKKGEKKAAPVAKEPAPKAPVKGSRAAPAHRAPKGTLAGKPFTPDTVLLLENSDGAKLLFTQRKQQRERWRCEEPMSDSELEISLYRTIADWVPSTPVETELSAWGMSGVESATVPAGTARIVLSKKDAKAFAVAGSIELAAGDGTWKLAGDFVGEYCPTKGIERETPEPLAGMPWGLEPVAPEAVPEAKLAAIVAGHSQSIAHVTARDVEREGKRFTELLFFAQTPPDPCAPRPESSGMTTFNDDGSIASRDVAPFRIDNFRIELAKPIAKGDRLAGRVDGRNPDTRTQIADADLQVFEADDYRSWRYWQYYSAALTVADVTDESVSARVYLALPDDGKSMLVGSFDAKRCR